MQSSLHHFNQYSTESPFSWQGLTSNRFPRSRLMHPRRDIIQTGLELPDQAPSSGRKHYDPLRSSQGEFRPTLRQFRNVQHWHPRESSKRVLDLQLTQPHPRREKGHFDLPFYQHHQKSAGIRTFYNARVKDGIREYSLEDRMQRKVKLNQLEIRKGAFQNEALSTSLKLKF